MEPLANEVATTSLMGLSALVGSLSRGAQWKDPQSGKLSLGLAVAGISTAIMLAEIANAVGDHYGVEVSYRIAGAAILGYIGPSGVIGFITKMVQQRYGDQNANTPPTK